MISYIKGELADRNENGVVVENNGIGYALSVPTTVLNQLPRIGSQVKLHTYFYVREDAMKLYGFLSKDDLDMFKLLLTISGIGPKGALGILSAITPDDLRFAILADDAKAISKAPGIGLKTARKMILELKDKMKLEDAFEMKQQHMAEQAEAGNTENIVDDAVQALTALGYSSTDALKAVRKVEITGDMDVETLLKAALKQMTRF